MSYIGVLFKGIFRGLTKVLGIFKDSGLMFWVGITLYVFYDNREGLQTFFDTGNLWPFLKSVGDNLGHADKVILDNTREILNLNAGSTEFKLNLIGFHLYTIDTTLLTYVSLLVGIIGALAYIAWYFKAFDKVWEMILGPGTAHYWVTFILGPFFYGSIVFMVRDINPFVGVAAFLQNWEQVLRLANQSDGVELARNLSSNLTA